MWGFADLRAKAIDARSADRLDPALKIAIAKQYNVDKWLFPALQALARCDQPLTTEQAQHILDGAGLDFLVKISALRETFGSTSKSVARSNHNFDNHIDRLFGVLYVSRWNTRALTLTNWYLYPGTGRGLLGHLIINLPSASSLTPAQNCPPRARESGRELECRDQPDL
jgi:hypothetical protein